MGLREGESKDIIIISAHYDHLGIIDGQLYPGANIVLRSKCGFEIINGWKTKNGLYYALCFWGAEEKGLLGSQYL